MKAEEGEIIMCLNTVTVSVLVAFFFHNLCFLGGGGFFFVCFVIRLMVIVTLKTMKLYYLCNCN